MNVNQFAQRNKMRKRKKEGKIKNKEKLLLTKHRIKKKQKHG